MLDKDKIYYIENTFWKSKLPKLENIKKFNNIKYSNVIIFHFDYLYSLFKTLSSYKINDIMFIHAINVCLRYYGLLKQLYPYNKIYIIVETTSGKLTNKVYKINNEVFRSMIDIIPNFALIDYTNEQDMEDLKYFNSEQYKHVIYGNKYKDLKDTLDHCDCQHWKVLGGKLFIN